MEQKDVDELLAGVIAQVGALGIPISPNIQPQVKLNSRAKSRFGCCLRKGDTYVIELSTRLLGADASAVMQTLAHEVLHTCYGCGNHGKRWKSYAARMNATYGYAISRTDSPERLGLPGDAPPLYLLVCDRCGAQIGRSRRSAVVEHPERYRCRCGGKLRRVR